MTPWPAREPAARRPNGHPQRAVSKRARVALGQIHDPPEHRRHGQQHPGAVAFDVARARPWDRTSCGSRSPSRPEAGHHADHAVEVKQGRGDEQRLPGARASTGSGRDRPARRAPAGPGRGPDVRWAPFGVPVVPEVSIIVRPAGAAAARRRSRPRSAIRSSAVRSARRASRRCEDRRSRTLRATGRIPDRGTRR